MDEISDNVWIDYGNLLYSLGFYSSENFFLFFLFVS